MNGQIYFNMIMNKCGFNKIDFLSGSEGTSAIYLIQDHFDNNKNKILKILWETTNTAKNRIFSEHNAINDIRKYITRTSQNIEDIPPKIIETYNEPIEFQDGYGILLEYAAKGSLKNQIKENQNLNTQIKYKYILQLLSGLKLIHNAGYCHNDLKPENLLLINENLLKIADFGSALKLGNNVKCLIQNTTKGTYTIQAPENLSGSLNKEYTKQSDIYSTGCVIYWIFHPRYHFPINIIKDFGKDVHQPDQNLKDLTDKLIETPESIKEIIRKCLSYYKENRPSIDEIIDVLKNPEGKINVKAPVSQQKTAQPIPVPVQSSQTRSNDEQDYQQFNKVYTTLKTILDSNLRKDDQFNLVNMERVEQIHKGIKGLNQLAIHLTNTPYASETNNKLNEVLDKKNQIALEDKKTIEDLVSSLVRKGELVNSDLDRISRMPKSEENKKKYESIGSNGRKEIKEILDEITKRIYLWGPPIATPNSERQKLGLTGKERYTLEEINQGKHKEALI